jgi:hypothetical protein
MRLLLSNNRGHDLVANYLSMESAAKACTEWPGFLATLVPGPDEDAWNEGEWDQALANAGAGREEAPWVRTNVPAPIIVSELEKGGYSIERIAKDGGRWLSYANCADIAAKKAIQMIADHALANPRGVTQLFGPDEVVALVPKAMRRIPVFCRYTK